MDQENILTNWENCGLLKDLSPQSKKLHASILENTKIINEKINNSTWKRLSFPLTVRILRGSILNKLVSVQPFPDEDLNVLPIIYNGKQINPAFIINKHWDSVFTEVKNENLEEQAERVAKLARLITSEMDREVINDIVNCPEVEETTWDWTHALGDTIMEKYESLYVKLIEISNKIPGGGNVIITSHEIASIFENATSGILPTNSFGAIEYSGTINNRWRLYKDENFPKNQMLIAHRGEEDPYDSGYLYCSKIVAALSYKCFEKGVKVGTLENLTSNSYKIETIYAKKMVDHNFFKKLKIENFVI